MTVVVEGSSRLSTTKKDHSGAVRENVLALKAILYTKGGNSGNCYYHYDVEFDGDLVVQDSKDPECDLARVLEARGYTGTVTMLDATTVRPRTIINIEKAARLAAR